MSVESKPPVSLYVQNIHKMATLHFEEFGTSTLVSSGIFLRILALPHVTQMKLSSLEASFLEPLKVTYGIQLDLSVTQSNLSNLGATFFRTISVIRSSNPHGVQFPTSGAQEELSSSNRFFFVFFAMLWIVNENSHGTQKGLWSIVSMLFRSMAYSKHPEFQQLLLEWDKVPQSNLSIPAAIVFYLV